MSIAKANHARPKPRMGDMIIAKAIHAIHKPRMGEMIIAIQFTQDKNPEWVT